jgi:5-methylcytosine-specific restriction endonuclease McrA
MSLRSLSDQLLLSRVLELTRDERSLTLSVLIHLNEIERRCLHLKLGYASMYAYCTSALGYSNSAASRRIRTARCVARFPAVYPLLAANEVNVSTVAQVSRILTAANQDTVLARIRGKSQREVEAIVAEYEPREALPRDRVRSVVVRVPAAPLLAAAASTGQAPAPGEAASHAASPAHASGAPSRPPAPHHHRPASRPQDDTGPGPESVAAPNDCPSQPVAGDTRTVQVEKRHVVEFCASDEFVSRLAKVRALMWHRLPANPSMDAVLSFALEYLIEREDPKRRLVRRSQRQRPSGPRPSRSNPRHIPAMVRDTIFVRDRGRCTFIGPTGQRCGSTHALQVDHVVPVAHGGAATPDNLRLLCARHNRIEAERILGGFRLPHG